MEFIDHPFFTNACMLAVQVGDVSVRMSYIYSIYIYVVHIYTCISLSYIYVVQVMEWLVSERAFTASMDCLFCQS